MGFRTVIVSSRCKIEHRLNYLVLRGESEKKIFIKEINTLIVQSTAVALTASALCELTKNNVKIIFCDEKCNPQTELVPYYGAHNTSKRYKMQIAWKRQVKESAWMAIIRRKILNQSDFLLRRGFSEESKMLRSYEK
ncbi:MAG: CRISPR-associated endonuclease Cas1 [Clostridia bacterium]|nr:CRISPR-associated endonuclease Cas1 [Clostridia bacterium]